MFYIFAGHTYYPMGGIKDLIGDATSIEEALEKLANESYDWWHVTDDNYEIVRES